APAQDIVTYETVSTWPRHGVHSAYSGPPSDENNAAWDALTRSMFFNASAGELRAAGETLEDSVQFPDGSYLASLGVSHDVHCLRQVRLYFYRDTYYPHLTPRQDQSLRGHVGNDHCIEALRLSVMCTGDVGMYSFYWKEGQDPRTSKPGTKTRSLRKCVVWDKVQAWSEKRMVPKSVDVVRP
ncbi:hypothetical protein EJ04DRAFT_394626, partial [Polyplosphaeria fusca]